MKHLFLILSLISLLGIAPVVQGQANTITVDNAAEVSLLGRMGRGTPLALAWSPDGEMLAVGTSIGVWLYADGGDITTEPRFFESEFAVNAIAFSPDGNQLASGDNRYLTSWDIATGEQVLLLEPVPNDRITALIYSVDGSQIIGGTEDGLLVAIDAVSGEVVTTAEGHTNDVRALIFSPDGSLLASASVDKTIRIWSDLTETALLEGHTSDVSGLAFSPDGSVLYSGSYDQTVRLWDTATWTEAGLWEPAERKNSIAALALSPDGSTLIAGETNNYSVRFWDTATGTEKMLIVPHKARVMELALSPDGTTLASTGEDAWLNLIDAASGEVVSTSYDHTTEALSVVFSPDSTLVSVSYRYRNLRVWDAATQALVHLEQEAFDTGSSENVAHNLFTPDGSKLATANFDGVHVYDTATWTELYHNTATADMILFSGDGSLLIVVHTRTIYLYKTEDGTLLTELTGHKSFIKGIAISPDGTLLASVSEDGTVLLWGVQ